MENSYIEMITLIERLHRRFLDLVKGELDLLGIRDINNVQSVLLLTIGDERMTVGELRALGFYLGSNISYNIKKMTQNGYLLQERWSKDRRVIYVQASAKGRALGDRLRERNCWLAGTLAEAMIGERELESVAMRLRSVERLWLRLSDGTPPRDNTPRQKQPDGSSRANAVAREFPDL
jgi:DNA-binding MarR family transcriptional regulator